jgi:hypothetical protein
MLNEGFLSDLSGDGIRQGRLFTSGNTAHRTCVSENFENISVLETDVLPTTIRLLFRRVRVKKKGGESQTIINMKNPEIIHVLPKKESLPQICDLHRQLVVY